MNRIFSILIILSIFTSCQIENVEQTKKEFAQKRAKEKREQRLQDKRKLEVSNVDLLPQLSSLKKLKATNCGMINMVNGLPINLDSPMPIRDDVITFKGFAYDKSKMKLAGGAIVLIDSTEYEISDWTPRRKFAEKKGQQLLMTGFNFKINASALGAGIHKVNLYVVTADKEQYFDSKREFEIEIIR